MDKTLGVSNVISTSNVEGLIDSMKAGLTAEVTKEAEERISQEKRKASASTRKAHEARRLAEERAVALNASLDAHDVEDFEVLQGLMEEINRRTRTRRRLLKAAIIIVVGIVGIGPLLSESIAGVPKLGILKFAILILCGIIDAMLAAFHVLDRPLGVDRHLARFAQGILSKLARERRLDGKLARFKVGNQGGRLSVEMLSCEATEADFVLLP